MIYTIENMVSRAKTSESVEIFFDASPGFESLLSGLARETGDSEGDILVKSLALMAIAIQAKKQGKALVIKSGEHNFTEIAEI
ncbi:MAG: hypothetical protein QOE96_1079 [Blastocatellia bacterium]|jgi:hypothetical protein|nr:hypothetical protein [Blastocatellia bacterium]